MSLRHAVTMTVAVLVGVGCGGGGSGGAAPTPPPPPPRYTDVLGFGVTKGAETVPVTKWPSWLHEGELVDACAPGTVFYADRCWDEVVIDVDGGSVTFTATGGKSATLAMGAAVPAELGTLVLLLPPQDFGGGLLSQFGPHHPNSGYVMMAGPWIDNIEFSSADVWDTPITPTPAANTRPQVRSPWALGSEIQVKDGQVSAFLVRTTLLYGFRDVGTGGLPTYQVVHNWPIHGRLKVNGHELALPLHLGDVSAAAGDAPITSGAGVRRVDLAGGKVRLQSDRGVLEARSTYGGAGAGLTDTDLVTSVEFHDTSLL